MRRSILEMQYSLLKRISNGPVILTHLMADARLNQGSCKVLLEFLIGKGWVQRNPPFRMPKGKSIRKSYYTLTDEGRRILSAIELVYREFNLSLEVLP